MDYAARWKIIGELGEGGQGKVYRVLERVQFDIDQVLTPTAIVHLGSNGIIRGTRSCSELLLDSGASADQICAKFARDAGGPR